MTLTLDIMEQGRDIPLSHGQQFCGLLTRSNMAVRSNGQDTDLGYASTVGLTFEREDLEARTIII